MNYQNNNFYPGGYAYPQQQVKQPKFSNPLSPERIAQLRNNGGGFSLQVPKDDIDRSGCTHRDPTTHQWSLNQNPDGSVTCTICGETYFPTEDATAESVNDAVGLVINILQTTKMMYLDIPDNVCREYFQMIPFLKKLPQLYKIAADNFRQYDGTFMGQQQQQSAFNTFNMLTNPMMAQNPMMYQMQMPQMGMPGMQTQQPVQPMMGQPMYQAPQMGMNGNPFDAAGQQSVAAPQQPTQDNTVTTNKQMQL